MAMNSSIAIASKHVIWPTRHLEAQRCKSARTTNQKHCAAALDTAGLQDYTEYNDISGAGNAPCTARRQEQQLVDWIQCHGGFVHQDLVIVDDAPCGCRGMIASRDIVMPLQPLGSPQLAPQFSPVQAPSSVHAAPVLQQLLAACSPHLMPVIAVPEELYMTTDDAVQILADVIMQQGSSTSGHMINSSTGPFNGLLHKLLQLSGTVLDQRQQLAESLTRLQPPLLLALLLAYERNKGQDSRWYPYITTLPEQPPCGWFPLLQQRQQQHSKNLPCHQLHEQQSAHVSPDTLAAAAAAVQAKCSAAAEMYGAVIGVTAEDVVWAFGQVVSRAFGSGDVVGLAPLIDMLNHKQGSGTPQLLTVPEVATYTAQDGLLLLDAAVNAAVVPAAVTIAADNGNCLMQAQWPSSQVDSKSELHSSSDLQACSIESVKDRRFWAVCLAPQQQQPADAQQQLVLSAGEELYISYVASCDAATAYLNFGFVPPEKHST